MLRLRHIAHSLVGPSNGAPFDHSHGTFSALPVVYFRPSQCYPPGQFQWCFSAFSVLPLRPFQWCSLAFSMLPLCPNNGVPFHCCPFGPSNSAPSDPIMVPLWPFHRCPLAWGIQNYNNMTKALDITWDIICKDKTNWTQIQLTSE